eukprot:scaffold73082_cov36-Cyclotella_meneghiniana.AAC.3
MTDAELSGRSRNSMGPTGAGSLLSCGVGCAKDAGKIYKEELKDITKDIKKDCGCDKKDDKCRKACKEEEEEAKKDAEEKANEKYQKCTVNVSINPSPPLKYFEKVVTKRFCVDRHIRSSIIESKSMKTIHMDNTSVLLNLLWYLLERKS